MLRETLGNFINMLRETLGNIAREICKLTVLYLQNLFVIVFCMQRKLVLQLLFMHYKHEILCNNGNFKLLLER